MPEEDSSSETTPTPDRVATARNLSDLHQNDVTDRGFCWWCSHPWPCPTARWIGRVLARVSTGRR